MCHVQTTENTISECVARYEQGEKGRVIFHGKGDYRCFIDLTERNNG